MLLRRGLNDALSVLVWAVIPALAWWYFGDPRTLLVLLGSLGWRSCCAVMRRVRVMVCSVGLGLLYVWALGAVFGEPIAALASELQSVARRAVGAYQQLSVEERGRLESLLVPVLTGLLAALLQIVTC